METLDQAVDESLALLAGLTNAGLRGLAVIEHWLRTRRARRPARDANRCHDRGRTSHLLIIVRLLGVIIRAVLIVFLVLLVLHVVMPMTHAP